MSDSGEASSSSINLLGKLRPDGVPLAVITLAFVASRLVVLKAGVRYDLSTLLANGYWQYIDPELLRHDLLRSIFYLHGQPPVFNLFMGVFLELFQDPDALRTAFALVYLVLGIVLALATYRLAVGLGIARAVATAVALVVLLSPYAILFENTLFYPYPIAVLYVLASLAFLNYCKSGRLLAALACIATLSLMALVQSMFHLAWLCAMLALLLVIRRGDRRRVALIAGAPVLVVVIWYAKNALLYGHFVASTWTGMNLARISLFRLPAEVRDSLVREEKVSRVGWVLPFSSLDAYGGFAPQEAATGIPLLDEPRKSTGSKNLHNLAYIELSGEYLDGSVFVIRHFPQIYLQSVAQAALIYFHSPVDYIHYWNTNLPLIRPYYESWAKLIDGQRLDWPDTYERDYSKSQLYVAWFLVGRFVIALVFGGIVTLWNLRQNWGSNPRAWTFTFLLLNVAYISSAGVLLEFGENNRFHFYVEPLVLILFAAAMVEAIRRLAGPSRRSRQSEWTEPDVLSSARGTSVPGDEL